MLLKYHTNAIKNRFIAWWIFSIQVIIDHGDDRRFTFIQMPEYFVDRFRIA